MATKSKRLTLLSDAEQFALYGLPDFDDGQQLEYLSLSEAELALACGYCDQSHFSNDFRAFSGIDPSTYSANRGPWQNHAPIA